MQTDKMKVLLYLKKSGLDRSGQAPIMGRITYGRTIAQFRCKLSCDPKLWNARESRLNGKSREAVATNGKLERLLLSAQSAYQTLCERGIVFTATDIKDPLHPIAEQILALYTKEKSKGDYKIFPDTMSDWKLLSCLKAVGLACGIRTPLTWHCARHTFGTLTLEAGVPIESIAKMMGHSSIASTQIYAQVTDQKIAMDMDKLIKRKTN